jgi:hypothetical protein
MHVIGAPGVTPKTWAEITVDADGVRFHKARKVGWSVDWPEVMSIEVAGSDDVQNTMAGNILAFGVFGLLGPSEKKRHFLVVATDGVVATFEVHGFTPFEARARLRTNPHAAQRLKEPGGNSAEVPRSASVGDLERLVALHREGALTDDEFAAAKRQMLGL